MQFVSDSYYESDLLKISQLIILSSFLERKRNVEPVSANTAIS